MDVTVWMNSVSRREAGAQRMTENEMKTLIAHADCFGPLVLLSSP